MYIEYFGVLHLYCLQRASQTETLHWSLSPLLCTLRIRLISKRGLSGAHLDIAKWLKIPMGQMHRVVGTWEVAADRPMVSTSHPLQLK